MIKKFRYVFLNQWHTDILIWFKQLFIEKRLCKKTEAYIEVEIEFSWWFWRGKLGGRGVRNQVKFHGLAGRKQGIKWGR